MIGIPYVLNTLGLTISMAGGYIGAKGYFFEKNKAIHDRTILYFYNEEHFRSMLYQKYSEIFGFMLILLGALMQLIQAVFSLDYYYFILNKYYFWVVLVLLFLATIFGLPKVINRLSELELMKIRIPEEIRDYVEHKDDKVEANAQNAKISLDIVAKRLKLKRLDLLGNEVSPEDYILQQANAFCKKHGINIDLDNYHSKAD